LGKTYMLNLGFFLRFL